MKFVRLLSETGSWGSVKDKWRAQCAAFGEEFDSYAPGVMSVLEDLALAGHDRAWVYGLFENDDCLGVCQVNYTPIPGYEGPIIRVRMMTFSPKLDFGDASTDDYVKALGGFFIEIYRLSLGELPTKFLKFHLRSPADREFFDRFRARVAGHPSFEEFELRGMWLYIRSA